MSDRVRKIEGMNLNREQFLKAVERGRALLKELKKDYPELGLKPVFSRFGPGSGQCDLTTDLKKIVMEFPEMLAGESFNREGSQGAQKVGMAVPAVRKTAGDGGHKKHENSQKENVKRLRELLKEIKQAEKDGEKETISRLWKEVEIMEKELLAPDVMLYCDDVLIEYRPGELKYESLRRLQQDSRLPPGLNTVGNIRVIAGSLEFLTTERNENGLAD